MTDEAEQRPGTCDAGGPFAVGRERRMHLRAHGYWEALRAGRAMPRLDELCPARIAGLAANSVLVELRDGSTAIGFIGQALRDEAEIADGPIDPRQVPAQTILGVLLARVPAIVARAAPVGFEAELPGAGGALTIYRGMLLPFADGDGRLAAIYGVINWRQTIELTDTADIGAALGSVAATAQADAASAWSAEPGAALPPVTIAQRLATARTWAALTAGPRARKLGGVHGALAAAFDLLLAARSATDGFASLGPEPVPCDSTGAVTLVFGDAPGARLADRYAAVLDHGLRLGLAQGALGPLLDRHPRGYRDVAAAERHARRRAARAAAGVAARDWLGEGSAPSRPHVRLSPIDPGFALLFGARRTEPAVALPVSPGRRAAG